MLYNEVPLQENMNLQMFSWYFRESPSFFVTRSSDCLRQKNAVPAQIEHCRET
jgi:hypothetical protein